MEGRGDRGLGGGEGEGEGWGGGGGEGEQRRITDVLSRRVAGLVARRYKREIAKITEK